MSSSVIAQLEDGFKQLSTSEQLRLIERLVHHVHEATLKQANLVDDELALMATDPQIQGELRRIEQEFSHAEADGLDNLMPIRRGLLSCSTHKAQPFR